MLHNLFGSHFLFCMMRNYKSSDVIKLKHHAWPLQTQSGVKCHQGSRFGETQSTSRPIWVMLPDSAARPQFGPGGCPDILLLIKTTLYLWIHCFQRTLNLFSCAGVWSTKDVQIYKWNSRKVRPCQEIPSDIVDNYIWKRDTVGLELETIQPRITSFHIWAS